MFEECFEEAFAPQLCHSHVSGCVISVTIVGSVFRLSFDRFMWELVGPVWKGEALAVLLRNNNLKKGEYWFCRGSVGF